MPGIDLVSVVRVAFATLTGNRDTGGATLEQQLAKNLYFPQDDGILTKVQEAELAQKLDTSYTQGRGLAVVPCRRILRPRLLRSAGRS